MKYLIPTLLFFFIFLFAASAQVLTGHITDEKNEPIPFANVFVPALSTGTSSNVEGNYRLELPAGTWKLEFRYVGYQVFSTEVTIAQGTEKLLDVQLKNQNYLIPEIKVLASGEDPAYYIMRKAISLAPYYRAQVSAYTCKVYMKGNGKFEEIPILMRKTLRQEGFKEGEPIVYETLSKISFELPDVLKQEVIAMRSSGKQNSTNPMGYVINNLYETDKYGIVSPVSRNALKTYNFKLVGVFEERGRTINKIKVTPRQDTKEVFSGFIYIADHFWNIHSAQLSMKMVGAVIQFNQVCSEVAPNAWMPVNMDFLIDASILGLKARFKYVASLSEYKVTLNPSIDHSFLKKEMDKLKSEQQIVDSITQRGQLATAKTQNKKLDKLMAADNLDNRQSKKLNRMFEREVEKNMPEESLEIKSEVKYDQRKTKNDSAYWAQIRPVPLLDAEMKSFAKKDSFLVISSRPEYKDSVRNSKRQFKLKHLLTGHLYNYSVDSIKKRESLNYGGLFNPSGISYNTVDGFTLPVSFRYYKSDSTGKAMMIEPTLTYAFARKDVNTNLVFRRRFNGINRSVLGLAVGAGTVDFHENSAYSNLSNMTYSLYFERNDKRYYHRRYATVDFSRDVANGLNIGLAFTFRDSRSEENHTSFRFVDIKDRVFTPNIIYNPELGISSDGRHQEGIFKLNMNYTPLQRYRIRNGTKFYAESKLPTFSLRYAKSIRNVFGSDGDFDYLEGAVSQKFSFAINDRFSYQILGGGFLNRKKVFFENFRHFNTHLPVFMAGNSANTFRLLPFYNYSTSKRFIEAHANLNSRKLVLKQLPLLENTGLEESLFVNYLSTPGLLNYTELGYGINRIFALLNVEFVSSFSGTKYRSSGIKLVLNF